MGIAFAEATRNLLGLAQSNQGNRWILVISYAAIFFATVPRFFIGNLIHYDCIHCRRRTQLPDKVDWFRTGYGELFKNGLENLTDFYVSAIEFMILFAIGSFIGPDKGAFTNVLLALLALSVVDVFWQFFSAIRSRNTNSGTERSSWSWVVINLITGAYCLYILLNISHPNQNTYIATAVVFIVAAILDYLTNADFYFRDLGVSE